MKVPVAEGGRVRKSFNNPPEGTAVIVCARAVLVRVLAVERKGAAKKRAIPKEARIDLNSNLNLTQLPKNI